MAGLWKRIRNHENKSQLSEIDTSATAISSPTIIYLSGFLTVDNKPSLVAGGIKSIEDLLHNQPDLATPPQVYAWSHSHLRNIFNLAVYNLRPHSFYSADGEKLARAVILPLVSKDGKPLPFDEAQKNLRNLTFFGYSTGTIVAQEAFNASMKLMQDIGYKEEKARKLLQEVVLVSTGNISRPTKEKDRFTTLYLAGSNDLAVRWKNRIWSPLRNIFVKYSKQLKIKPVSDNSLLISAGVIKKKFWDWHKKPDGTQVKKEIDPLLPTSTFITSNHELPHYITKDDDHNEFSKIALHALIHAVNRKDKLEVAQLLEPIASHTPEEIAAYRKRIEKAKLPKKAA